MRLLRRHGKPFALLLLLALFASLLTPQVTHAASFDPTRIIDDGVFYNSTSMSVSQIQAFLNSKVPTCDNNGSQTYSGGTTRAAYTRSQGYGLPLVCLKDYYENPATHQTNLTTVDGQAAPIPAGAQSAAQIISTAASYYGINPQVLLVLLQKETGLVTDDWPWPSEYQTATGYGCPDSGPNHSANCSSLYFGFYNQVNWAAKQFRSYATSPNSFNYLPGPGNNVAYNPQPSCGSSNLNIQNQATASLYDYTPYQPNQAALNAGYGSAPPCGAYGNRNFWLYFNDWFGSTQFSQPIGGSLLYQASTNKVFLTSGSTRFYIPSWAMMTNYGLDAFPLQTVSDATIQQYTDGGTLTNLIYDSGGVYLVNNRVRYHVSSDMCTAWGFSCLDNTVVKSLGSTFQMQYLQTGPELTSLSNSNGVIYELSNGQRLPVANNKTMIDLGLNTAFILNTSVANINQPLGRLLMTTPGAVQFSPSTTIYYYDGSAYYGAPDINSYNDWSLDKVPQLSVPVSAYNTTPPSSQTLTPWYQDSSGNKYIVDEGRKVQIPTSMQSAWQAVAFATQPQLLANTLTQVTLQPSLSSGGIYQIAAGKSHHVPTWASYVALGISDNQTTVFQPDKMIPVPTGNDVLGNGVIIGLQGDQKRYVINNGKTTWVPDPNTYSSFGFDWGSVPTYSSSILSDYPLASAGLSSGVANGIYYVVGNGTMYSLSASLASDFGVVDSRFQSISPQLVNNAHSATLSKFLYNSDTGKVYYASGGAIHYVATYSAFAAYGGTHTAASAINNNNQNLFTEAQPVY